MLKKTNRLLKRKEFNYLYNKGRAKHTNNLTIVFTSIKNRPIKIGFSISKKVGKAHTRNLIKRRLRAVVRELVPALPNNYNVVIIAKPSVAQLTFEELKIETKTLFVKAGIMT